jgi:hypothetical protein
VRGDLRYLAGTPTWPPGVAVWPRKRSYVQELRGAFAQKGGQTVPVPRGSTRHCEAVEEHGARLRALVRTVEQVLGDGLVDPGEHQLLRAHMERVQESYRMLPAQAAQQDNVLRLIGALAGAGAVTPWIRRIAREAAEDEQRLDQAA